MSVFLLIIFSWLYIFYLGSQMNSASMEPFASEMAMPQDNFLGLKEFFALAVMWSVMMFAMMLPSAMPMIFVFSAVNKKRQSLGKTYIPTWIFISGYLVMWTGFGILAAGIQIILHNFSLLSANLKIINPFLSGITLICVGAYQFAKVKSVCLSSCQSPLGFILGNWKDGKAGAFLMGLHHGLYCIGCCWVLMALLFVAGIMNIFWIAIIAIFIFLEKTVKFGRFLGKIAGISFLIWGLFMVFSF